MVKTSPNSTSPELIAPCGINCRLCIAYVREKNPCPGCRGDDTLKSKSCVTCRMKNCARLGRGGSAFCYDCDEFPCERLLHLAIRYRTKYRTNVIDNLLRIQRTGLASFVQAEDNQWACPECGEMLSMHKPACLHCGYVWRE